MIQEAGLLGKKFVEIEPATISAIYTAVRALPPLPTLR